VASGREKVSERESTGSWAESLCGLRRRRMRAAVLAVGDGEVRWWPATRSGPPSRQSACWSAWPRGLV